MWFEEKTTECLHKLKSRWRSPVCVLWVGVDAFIFSTQNRRGLRGVCTCAVGGGRLAERRARGVGRPPPPAAPLPAHIPFSRDRPQPTQIIFFIESHTEFIASRPTHHQQQQQLLFSADPRARELAHAHLSRATAQIRAGEFHGAV